jgi:hypothetical protein
MFNLSAIWTHGDLKGGEWIVVDPNVVTISTFEPPAPIAPCGSWTYSDPTPEAQ